MDIRLIALDLDGTALLSDHKTLTPRLLHALDRAAEKGILVVPVTGRPLTLLPPALARLPWAILGNGSQIRNLAAGEDLLHLCIPRQPQLALMDLAQRLDLPLEFSAHGSLYLTEHSLTLEKAWPDCAFHCNTVLNAHGILTEDLRGLPRDVQDAVDKINLNCVEPSLRQEVTEAVAALELNGIWTSPPHMEITHSDATKGAALARLCARLEVPREAVMALGDSDNDLTMLSWAGLGIAMGNAPQWVRDRADAVTCRNDEDGAAAAIEARAL